MHCRFRPFNKREIALGEDKAVKIEMEPEGISLADPSTGRDYKFPFDYAFGLDTTQDQVRARPPSCVRVLCACAEERKVVGAVF